MVKGRFGFPAECVCSTEDMTKEDIVVPYRERSYSFLLMR